MANVKVRAGSVRNVAGAPLVGKTATLKNHATDAPMAAGTTDGTGAYSFTGIDETIRTRVEVAFGGGSAQMHVNAPISPDLDHAYVNSSLRSAAGATVAFGGPVSVGGAITIAGTITATNAPLISRSTSNARVMLIDTDAAANEKAWGINNQDGDVGIQPWNDAESSASGDGLFLIRGTGMAIANAGLTIGGVQRVFANTNGVVLTGANTNTGALTVTGQVLAAGGSAGTPGYAFVGDENTGLFRNNEGQISMVSNGTIRLSSTTTGADVQGGLGVSGAATVGGGLTINGGMNVATGNVGIVGQAQINSGLTLYGGLNLASGNGTVTGTLDVSGAVTVGGSLTTSGQARFGSGVATASAVLGVVRTLRIYDAAGTSLGYIPIYSGFNP